MFIFVTPHLSPHNPYIFPLRIPHRGGGAAGGAAVVDGNHALGLVYQITVAAHIAAFEIYQNESSPYHSTG